MKKVLFVNASLQIGGVERSLCDIINHVNREQYNVYLYLDQKGDGFFQEVAGQVTLVEPNMEGCYGPFVQIARTLVKQRKYQALMLRVTRSSKGDVLRGLKRILRKIYLNKYGSFDCVIAFREGAYASLAYDYFSAQKYICWWHGSNPPSENELPDYNKTTNFDSVVAVSSSTSKMIQDTIPSLKNLVVIPNMLDAEAIEQKATNSPYTGDMLHIVSVGRLAPEKHFENIIPAAKVLLETGTDFTWHIVGEGPERSKLETLIAENDLKDHVILEGSKANPYPYMKYADLFVHPSYVESQGLTVLEAMALGIPCVVTKSLGPCEFIEDGINGLLTEQSPESLTEKVLAILNDKELYQHIKENTKCPEQFSPERVMKQIETMIDGGK